MSELRFCTLCEQFISLDGAERVEINKHAGVKQLWMAPDGTVHNLMTQSTSDRRRMKGWMIRPRAPIEDHV